MLYYKHPVFMCTNVRADGNQSCQQYGAQKGIDKHLIKEKYRGALET